MGFSISLYSMDVQELALLCAHHSCAVIPLSGLCTVPVQISEKLTLTVPKRVDASFCRAAVALFTFLYIFCIGL